jgi:K+-sensing histidine kinase KdpD
MFELIDLGLEMHKRMIDAHQTSVAVARRSMQGAEAAVAIQKAMGDATKANLDMWSKWVSLWTPSK